MKSIIVTGATGLIGSEVVKALKAKHYRVIVFSRDANQAKTQVPEADHWVKMTSNLSDPWASELNGSFAVIHLAGASVAGRRWTDSWKKEIRDSRVNGTRLLVEAMKKAERKPEVFISGSAIGIYGPSDDRQLTESAPAGHDFLAGVGVEWEAESLKAKEFGIRTVLIRTGIVLDPNEGALKEMMLPFKFFAGGPVLPGTQWFSWIHIADEVGIILHSLETTTLSGPVNATAPNPVTMKTFSSILGKVMSRPSWFPVPGFIQRIVKGQVAEVLTTGQRVIPEKSMASGYQFKFSDCEKALRNLLGK
ncbi:MAG: TIGR01777 family oxidoreductase [Bacteroidetes bacterium]|nr:TIGR01777 family oxidoreductase [Bacteroidota bacterium]